MTQMYSFIEYVDLRDRIVPMAEVIELMGRESVECAKFIQRYSQKTISRRYLFLNDGPQSDSHISVREDDDVVDR